MQAVDNPASIACEIIAAPPSHQQHTLEAETPEARAQVPRDQTVPRHSPAGDEPRRPPEAARPPRPVRAAPPAAHHRSHRGIAPWRGRRPFASITTRAGFLPSQRRTFSFGSSASTVPMPTRNGIDMGADGMEGASEGGSLYTCCHRDGCDAPIKRLPQLRHDEGPIRQAWPEKIGTELQRWTLLTGIRLSPTPRREASEMTASPRSDGTRPSKARNLKIR